MLDRRAFLAALVAAPAAAVLPLPISRLVARDPVTGISIEGSNRRMKRVGLTFHPNAFAIVMRPLELGGEYVAHG